MRPSPGVGALLATPAFTRLWILGGFSNSMRQFETLAAALFTLQVTHSGFAVAVVSAARMMPMLLLGAPAGVFAEAINRRTILFSGLIITGLVSATLAMLAATGLAQPWHVAVGALVSGTVWSTENSTRRRMVGEAVEGPLIARALALDSVTNSLTRMVGPLLAGLVFELAGLSGCFILSAGCYAVAAALAAGVRHGQVPQRFIPASIPAELAEAVAFARTQPVIAGVLGVTVAMNFFAFCYSALVAPLGEEQFRISAALVGVLAAAEPGGGLIGGLLLTAGTPPVSGRTLMISGAMLFMVVIVLMPLSPSFGLATGALFIGGFGTAAFSNMQSALIITHAPGAIRSRLMGLLTVCIGTGPLGVLTVGALAMQIGNRAALVMMGTAGLVLVAWIGRAWRIAEARRSPPLPHAATPGVLADRRP